ncbi:hypothetical protein PAXINDRAFT_8746 [Paxillus involutus ATCC 200175]|nr:hypothetical protein PAXINDRAFT_8746 [Paxillus involutus ATCC 200175]
MPNYMEDAELVRSYAIEVDLQPTYLLPPSLPERVEDDSPFPLVRAMPRIQARSLSQQPKQMKPVQASVFDASCSSRGAPMSRTVLPTCPLPLQQPKREAQLLSQLRLLLHDSQQRKRLSDEPQPEHLPLRAQPRA